jgi:hypothetical protein
MTLANDSSFWAGATPKAKARQARHRRDRSAEVAKTLADNPGLREALDLGSTKDDAGWERSTLADMSAKLAQYGTMSERQVEFALSLGEKIANGETQADKDRQRKADMQGVPGWDEGRMHIEGVILSVRYKDDTQFPAWKMIVELDDGKRCWGTAPSALLYVNGSHEVREYNRRYDHLKGERVRFTATMTKSDRDEHFAFFKRPHGAEFFAETPA